MTQQFHSWVYIQKTKTKTLIWKDTFTLMFIAALFTIAKIWKQPKCPSIDERIKKIHVCMCYTYNGILLNHKKEQNFAIWNNMDGLEGHYAKGNKSHRERQTLYDSTYKIGRASCRERV